MKKYISVLAIIFIISLAACSNQTISSTPTGNESNIQSNSITTLDKGIWPVNEYTEGLPIPPGTVAWATLDTEHENCSVNLTGISDDDYSEYMEVLNQEGFGYKKSRPHRRRFGSSWPEVTQTRRCPDHRNSTGQLLRPCRSRPLRTPCIRPPALVSMAGGGTGFPSGRRFSFYQIRLCTCNLGAFSSHTSGTGRAGAPEAARYIYPRAWW